MCIFKNSSSNLVAKFIFQHAETLHEGPRPESQKQPEVQKDSNALEALARQQALNLVIDAAMRHLDAARKAGQDQKLQEIAAGLDQVAKNPYILGGAATGSAPDVVFPWVKEALQKPKEDKGKQK